MKKYILITSSIIILVGTFVAIKAHAASTTTITKGTNGTLTVVTTQTVSAVQQLKQWNTHYLNDEKVSATKLADAATIAADITAAGGTLPTIPTK